MMAAFARGIRNQNLAEACCAPDAVTAQQARMKKFMSAGTNLAGGVRTSA